jgi:hypothetical protein
MDAGTATGHHGAAMLPAPWPSDGVESTQLLARLVRTIDERGKSADHDLLALFYFTAWPTLSAQVQ